MKPDHWASKKSRQNAKGQGKQLVKAKNINETENSWEIPGLKKGKREEEEKASIVRSLGKQG